MDFLKILISTLVIALITALVFLALYFVFPSVAEAQFGVSVEYTPERMPSSSLNGKLAAERDKADRAEALPEEKKEEKTVVDTVEDIVEKVSEAVAPQEKKEEAPSAAPKEEKKAEPAEKEEPKAGAKPAPEPDKTEPTVALTEGGELIRDFMESTKMQVVMSFLPDSVDAGALKKPSEWNDNDRAQINKIGDYIVEHDIDIAAETKISNILKIVNTKEVPEHLQGLIDFVKNEVKF